MSNQRKPINKPVISKNNPYVVLSTEDPNETNTNSTLDNPNPNTTAVRMDGFFVDIPDSLLEKAIEIERYSCSVRFICLLDVFINLFYMMYGYLFGFIFIIASMMGYLSTVYHKRNYLCCYLLYQYMQTIAKFINTILVIAFVTNNPAPSNATSTMVAEKRGTDTILIILSFIVMACQVYITRFIYIYYNLLPNDQERAMLTRRSSL